MDSAKRSLNVFRQLENYFFPQDLDWTLVFVSFLSRYPSDTDTQIYSNTKTRIWNPILLVFIWCTVSFQICLWSSPFAHQCFVHYHSIAPGKILNLDGLSLVSSWKLVCFMVLSVDFKGSHKNVLESLCSEYSHYLSDYLFSSIQQLWITCWLP